MPDHTPGPLHPIAPDASERARLRKRRAGNIIIALVLLAWVLVMYIAVMVKVDSEIRP